GKEDGGPVFGRFVTENNDGNQQKYSGTDSIQEPNNWKEQVEAILQPSLSAAEARVTLMMQQFVESIESKILSALKQAAMDIIKHLGKEAAMRVLVAERKAVHFEQDLINTKKEAITMLVRLKQSMDTQITEAERACQSERRRAQEMEEKLITAKDTINKLMNELERKGEVQMQMAQPLDEQCAVQMQSPTEYSTMQAKSLSRQLPEDIFIGKPYLPSIIMKRKEKPILANGYGYDHGIYGETINESIADALPDLEGNEIKARVSDLLPYSAEKRHVDEMSLQGQTVMSDINSFQKQDAGCSLRQRTLLVTCTVQSSSCDGCLVQTERRLSPSSESDAFIGTENKTLVADKSTVTVGNVEKQKDLASFREIYNASFFSQDREAETRRSESSKTSDGDEKPTSSGMENPGMMFEDKEADVGRPLLNRHVQEKDGPEDDCRTSSSTKLVNNVISVQCTLCSSHAEPSLENGGITLETAGNQVAGEGGVLIEAIQSDDKMRLLVHSNTTKQECDKASAIGKPSAIENSENCPGQMTDTDAGQSSETKINMGVLDQRVHSRPTKFTFQRKRRRESPFQQNGNLIQEEKDPNRGQTKQHEYFPIGLSCDLPQKHRTTTLVSQKSSLVAESSQDSRPLMQGACQ
ncbi:hypothetical protein KI387_013091, partial [Taxus chinensis]